ncbi:MAG: tetratricopeptide repeat protein [Planctomycetes bacterium]|jgi:tetratricopeptide (TPR) repeat protein|nr:tetratricopeptide repeat protein [Planctomycetota bacterium]
MKRRLILIGLLSGAALCVAAIVGIEALRRRAAAADLPSLPDPSEVPPSVLRCLRESDRAARAAPRDVSRIGALALDYHANLRATEALVVYAMATALAPGDPAWSYGPALLHLDQGDFRAALGRLRETQTASPEGALLAYRIGDCHLRLGERTEAEAEFARALALDTVGSPSARAAAEAFRPRLSVFARMGLARLRLLAGEPLEAERMLLPVVGVEQVPPDLHRLRAEICRTLGRDHEAAREEEEAERATGPSSPADPFLLALLERSHHPRLLVRAASEAAGLGDRVRAESLLRRATAVAPESSESADALATFLSATGRPEEGIRLLVDRWATFPGDEATRSRLVELLHGFADLSLRAGAPGDAERVLRAVVSTLPEEPDLRRVLAAFLARTGNTVEAILEYRKAIAADARAETYLELARLLLLVGYPGEARMQVERALELRPGWPEAEELLEEITR